MLAVFEEFLSKPSLQFRVFHSDHHRASHDRKRGQRPADQQSRSGTPGKHLAEMCEINWMPHSRSNPARHKPLFSVSCDNFWKAGELPGTEADVTQLVQPHADRKENSCRKPAPPRRVNGRCPPMPRDCAEANPHQQPCRDQHFIGRARAGTPAVRSRVDHEPERRDRRIYNARQPPERSREHHFINFTDRCSFSSRSAPNNVILRRAQPSEGPYDCLYRRCCQEVLFAVSISAIPVDITEAFRHRMVPRAGVAAAQDDIT